MRPVLSLLVALAALVPSASHAQLLSRTPPQHRLVYKNAIVARVNPQGLIDDARLMYRLRLYTSDLPALRDNFVSVGLAGQASPAFGRLGVAAEVQPLTVLQLSAVWERVQYFGTMSYLQSFPSARSTFSDPVLAERAALPVGDPQRHYAAGGSQLTLGASLQLKAGPLVVRSQAKLVRPDFALREGDRVLYDIVYDTLVPNRGWLLSNDADVLWAASERLMVGLRWTATQAFYGPEHFAPGESQVDPTGALHRVGPLVAYTLFSEDGARFNNPTLFATAAWHVRHPYRAGQVSSALVPMVALGVSFNGDLLPLAD